MKNLIFAVLFLFFGILLSFLQWELIETNLKAQYFGTINDLLLRKTKLERANSELRKQLIIDTIGDKDVNARYTD